MPIFEYTCQRCGADFELLLASTTAAARCPECDSARLRRHLSLFAVAGGRAPAPAAGSAGAKCSGCRSRNCAGCH